MLKLSQTIKSFVYKVKLIADMLMIKYIESIKCTIRKSTEDIKDLLIFIYEETFLKKPWYWFPIRFLIVFFGTLYEIGNTPIIQFRRKGSSAELGQAISSLFKKLNDNDLEEWTEYVEDALYISQSAYEVKGQLMRILPVLLKQKFSKKLNLRKEVKVIMSYLCNF